MALVFLRVETPLCVIRPGPDKQRFKRAKISRFYSELTDSACTDRLRLVFASEPVT